MIPSEIELPALFVQGKWQTQRNLLVVENGILDLAALLAEKEGLLALLEVLENWWPRHELNVRHAV